jgi:hypothetical protein
VFLVVYGCLSVFSSISRNSLYLTYVTDFSSVPFFGGIQSRFPKNFQTIT